MNKNEIVEKVSQVTCAKTEAKDAVEMFLTVVKTALSDGQRVTISDFGTFYVKFNNARKGRNPRTGEIVDIPPRKVVKFIPSPKLNESL